MTSKAKVQTTEQTTKQAQEKAKVQTTKETPKETQDLMEVYDYCMQDSI